jgi:hypothetical protein
MKNEINFKICGEDKNKTKTNKSKKLGTPQYIRLIFTF